jgi:type I restriction enzyme R subunit
MLEETLDRYNREIISAAEILQELVILAREMREASQRGENLGLNDDELAFYDALEVNDSAVAVLGEPILKEIAQELVQRVRRNVSIDWELRASARARMRIIVKRILRKHGYPPDKQQKATETVIAQAELLSREWGEVE